jgi:hypothetical protein
VVNSPLILDGRDIVRQGFVRPISSLQGKHCGSVYGVGVVVHGRVVKVGAHGLCGEMVIDLIPEQADCIADLAYFKAFLEDVGDIWKHNRGNLDVAIVRVRDGSDLREHELVSAQSVHVGLSSFAIGA